MFQRILVATDGSTLSRKATRAAVGLAAATGADLVALIVVPRYPTSYFEGSVSLSSDDIARTERNWADKAHEVVDAVSEEARRHGVNVRGVVVNSDLVAEAIMSAAKKNKCDLIVMASHGRKGLKRVLLGSETQQVLTHGTTPVLVLR